MISATWLGFCPNLWWLSSKTKFDLNLWKAEFKCWPISGVFSDTGNMSPIMVENMVMANIIVTPEKRRAMKRRAKTVKTITLRQNLGHLDRSCIGWKILPCLEKCFLAALQAFHGIPSAGQFLKGVLFMIILSTVVKHTLKCLGSYCSYLSMDYLKLWGW